MNTLLLALGLFVATHLLMSHPLRAPLVSIFGRRGFDVVYSLIALGSFGWAVLAFRAILPAAHLWSAGDGIWVLATILMLLASLLFVGSFRGNPALPAPDADKAARADPRGVFAITRHPMMWSFLLWSVCHMLVSPQPKVIALTLAIGLLALIGSIGQDHKKAHLMGDAWRHWASRTSFVPFAGQVRGTLSWRSLWPGTATMSVALLFWLGATWAHLPSGVPAAGIWHWVSG